MTKERRDALRAAAKRSQPTNRWHLIGGGETLWDSELLALLDSDERLEAARTAWRDGNYDNLSAALLQEPKR